MITFLANLVIPLFIFTLVLYGTLKRKDIYTPFLEGVMDGFKIVLEIAPTLIALFFAIQIFRSSGALDLIVRFLTPMGKLLKIPKEVLPVIFAKLFSSSAATGFLLDIYKTSGADSLAGFMSSVILSSTETCLLFCGWNKKDSIYIDWGIACRFCWYFYFCIHLLFLTFSDIFMI